jgi:hypothetical protein
MPNNPLESVESVVGSDSLVSKGVGLVNSVKDVAGGFAKGLDSLNNAVGSITSALDDPGGFMSNIRGLNLPTDAVPTFSSLVSAATVNTGENDWRVRLTVPNPYISIGGPLIQRLIDTNNSMVFPFTPSVIMMHSANYNSLQPVHTNYPYQIYENSTVNAIQITGDFYVENSDDAEYWLASMHFLRSITKMFYGESSSNAGAPPPLSRLNGYGDYVFKDVPCVIRMFQVELAQDIDYIKCDIPGGGTAFVPSHSIVTVEVMPTYSRDTIRQFSLDDFVSGALIGDSKGFI